MPQFDDLLEASIQHAHEMNRALNRRFDAGLKAGKEISRLAHLALKEAYARAQADPEVKIPTPLHFAIENVLRLREEEALNDYVDAGVKRDQLARHEGRSDHDMSTRGTAMRAGS